MEHLSKVQFWKVNNGSIQSGSFRSRWEKISKTSGQATQTRAIHRRGKLKVKHCKAPTQKNLQYMKENTHRGILYMRQGCWKRSWIHVTMETTRLKPLTGGKSWTEESKENTWNPGKIWCNHKMKISQPESQTGWPQGKSKNLMTLRSDWFHRAWLPHEREIADHKLKPSRWASCTWLHIKNEPTCRSYVEK